MLKLKSKLSENIHALINMHELTFLGAARETISILQKKTTYYYFRFRLPYLYSVRLIRAVALVAHISLLFAALTLNLSLEGRLDGLPSQFLIPVFPQCFQCSSPSSIMSLLSIALALRLNAVPLATYSYFVFPPVNK